MRISRIGVCRVGWPGRLEDEIPQIVGLKEEQFWCTFVSSKAWCLVHIVPRSIVGFGEVSEVQVDHTPTRGHMDGSIDMVATVVVSDGGILDALYGVGWVGFNVNEDI